MPKIHVSNCPAGFVLDAAVAMAQGLHIDNLAGYWKDDAGNNVHPACVGCDGVPTWHPSGDIRAAWELWQRIKESSWTDFYDRLEDLCTHNYNGEPVDRKYGGVSEYDIMASINPLTITRAFLLTNGVTEVEVPAP
jgi:hypothetical protein